mmetsp:Transcript_17721/g.41207  ORF Transcript_17721/g.41207 Transcript_17721/m.41207 type:complete len:351 (-) Transcript_17721:196-1248(-)
MPSRPTSHVEQCPAPPTAAPPRDFLQASPPGMSRQASRGSPDLGLPPRPPSQSRLKLEPLGHSPQVRSPVSSQEVQSAACFDQRRPQSGHVAALLAMRRSMSSGSCGQMAQLLAAPEAGWGASLLSNSVDDGRILRPPSPSVRVRRSRRPADFGAGLGLARPHHQARSTSCRAPACSGTSSEHVSTFGQGNLSLPSAPATAAERSSSMPPTGTDKADEAEAAKAKARAVVALQRLFFEEVQSGQDPNEAAARALRRLSEAPGPASRTGTLSASGAFGIETSDAMSVSSLAAPAIMLSGTTPIVAEESLEDSTEICPVTPHRPLVDRPSPAIGGRGGIRRPSPLVRAAVRG